MSDSEEKSAQFHEMELDDRILKAIVKLGWMEPTLIQEKAIPLMLEGKDVLIRARTGSGKTAAFAVPVIQKILNLKQTAVQQDIKALILAPSKELCSQLYRVFLSLTVKCSREVRCIDISQQIEIAAQKPLLVEKPDIVISTPARILMHLRAKNLDIKESLELLIIDEADLIFSFGYEKDMKDVLKFLPKIYQAALASATLSTDVQSLKKLILHSPVTLKLEEPDLPPTSQLTHYHLAAEDKDKAAILYALLKLNLIRGKTIIFVNTVDRCYRLRLFLHQFAIPTCVLNSELPSTIRCHSIQQFNQGVYDIIIASDEKSLEEPGNPREKKSKRKKDKESGVSRGIDFQFVSNVINFDFPLDVDSYIHRAGRTARGNNEGNVLSFVNLRERPLLDNVEKQLKTGFTEENIMKAYQFKLEEVEGFRYRAQDAWKKVTKIAIREARLKEIKHELFNCQKLKSHFEDNPKDLKILRHDKALHTVKAQPHLANVPDYIIPNALKNLVGITKRKRKDPSSFTRENKKYKEMRSDPLLSMEFMGSKKRKR